MRNNVKPSLFGEKPSERHQHVICVLDQGGYIYNCICVVVSSFPLCSRVLEASIAENKASLKRTHTEVWSDSPDPHDRKRMDNCPVGLKNVGNTCWFSAVIQVDPTVP